MSARRGPAPAAGPALVDEIERRALSGESDRQIGDALGLAKSLVWHTRKRCGIPAGRRCGSAPALQLAGAWRPMVMYAAGGEVTSGPMFAPVGRDYVRGVRVR